MPAKPPEENFMAPASKPCGCPDNGIECVHTARYSILNVRLGNRPSDYIVTILRDGKPQGEVVIRAVSNT